MIDLQKLHSLKVIMISRSSLYTVPGGDTVQVTETAKALRTLGLEVTIKLADEFIDYNKFDLIHFFNIIRPNNISLHVKKSKLPYVISTIFVDYSEIEKSHRGFSFRLLSHTLGSDSLEYLKILARELLNGESVLDYSYYWKGHKKSVENLLNNASILLPNSHSEYERLKERYKFKNQYCVIPNAVSNDFHLNDQEEKVQRSGVLCIGRIEFIKNQLNLIKALRNTDISLKIIGKAAPNHHKYYQECKLQASENIQFLGQLSKEEIIQELKKAKVHVLPSFFETTGLSSLEAGALGCNIVITKKGDTEEYFKDLAYYCKPEDPTSIRESIQKALNAESNSELAKMIQEEYTWEKAAQKTLEAYQKIPQLVN